MEKRGDNEPNRMKASSRVGRLAAALRVNLLRRKALARGRADKDKSGKDGESGKRRGPPFSGPRE